MVRFAGHNDPQTMVLLLKLGANPNAVWDGTSALQAARDVATLKLLLDAGANPNVSEKGGSAPGSTPLHHFAETDDLEAVKALLAHGAQVDAADSYGNTALARAAVYGRLEIGRALLQAKADPNHRAKDGTTPLDEARSEGHDDFVQMLLGEGGARESEVTAKDGNAVALGDAPVQLIGAYEDALRAHDAVRLGQFKPSLAGYDWSRTDWDALLSGRPARVEEATGFASDEHATIRVRGPTADGKPRGLTIGYELKRIPTQAAAGPLAPFGGWQIEREWIEWGELKQRR
jgi:ankyrin repeat protein